MNKRHKSKHVNILQSTAAVILLTTCLTVRLSFWASPSMSCFFVCLFVCLFRQLVTSASRALPWLIRDKSEVVDGYAWPRSFSPCVWLCFYLHSISSASLLPSYLVFWWQFLQSALDLSILIYFVLSSGRVAHIFAYHFSIITLNQMCGTHTNDLYTHIQDALNDSSTEPHAPCHKPHP